MDYKRIINRDVWPDLIRRFLLAWMFATTAVFTWSYAAFHSMAENAGFIELSLLQVTIVAAAVFGALWFLARIGKTNAKWERWVMFLCFLWSALLALHLSFTVPFLCALLLVGIMFIVYAWRGWKGDIQSTVNEYLPADEKRFFVVRIAGGVLSVLFCIFVSVWSVSRVLTYSSTAFDFGIFSQMFHYMKTTGLPYTIIERNKLLSHFKVHTSLVWYLLLPFYYLYPYPVTLQVLQAVILALASVPMWKLARRYSFSPLISFFWLLILFSYPSYSGGVNFDLHENTFLMPLLLGLFCALESRRKWPIIIFSVLILMIKEDAAIYVAVVALWIALDGLLHSTQLQERRWKIRTGSLLFAGAVLWFVLATGYLRQYGEGVMIYRYENFTYGGSPSVVTVMKNMIVSPMKVLYECVESDRLFFLAMTMLPLGGYLF